MTNTKEKPPFGEKADCPHGYKNCCGKTVRSVTRYTVHVIGDEVVYFDSIEAAVNAATRRVYGGDSERLVERLRAGEAVSYSYGFCSVTITPPNAD